MKIYLAQNVFDAALDRIRYLFDEFPNVVVNISGGKDSTVVLNLALMVAEEKHRLPLKVMFIDQEAEWQTVIDHIRVVMSDPRIEPIWLQIPIKIFNATSTIEPWLYCWQEGKQWIREKEPNSVKVNRYGTDRFAQLFSNFLDVEYPDQPACQIAGIRAEESQRRFMGMTSIATYKAVTWGKIDNKQLHHYSFYPIYDWSYTDDWKAIHDHHWPYCPIYDIMYQYGVPVMNMRVSNVHHETAVQTLFYLQEVEAETWNKITKRISGISTAGHLGKDDFFLNHPSLPFMFSGWKEYRDYLLANLISTQEIRDLMAHEFLLFDQAADRGWWKCNEDKVYQAEIASILANDYHLTKLNNFRAAQRNEVGRKHISIIPSNTGSYSAIE